jgi:hypothetical protein
MRSDVRTLTHLMASKRADCCEALSCSAASEAPVVRGRVRAARAKNIPLLYRKVCIVGTYIENADERL